MLVPQTEQTRAFDIAPWRNDLQKVMTARDIDVLEARIQGLGVKATARTLATSPAAVRRALRRLYEWKPQALENALGKGP